MVYSYVLQYVPEKSGTVFLCTLDFRPVVFKLDVSRGYQLELPGQSLARCKNRDVLAESLQPLGDSSPRPERTG